MNLQVIFIGCFIFSALITNGQTNKKSKKEQNKTLTSPNSINSQNSISFDQKVDLKDKKPIKKVEVFQTNQVRSFTVNGIRVILKPANNEVVSINFFISGGVKNYSLAQQGIENLTLNTLIDGGSKKYPKEQFHNIIESKGISISPNVNFDYSIIQVQSTTKTFNEAWSIISDLMINPSWDVTSCEQMKNQISTGLLQQAQDPDESLDEIARKGTYLGTPYEKNPEGTTEIINSLGIEDVKKYYQSILQGQKLIISICGKIDEGDLKSKIQEAFGKIPKGESSSFSSNPPVFNKNKLFVEEREIATNYIRGQLNAPKLGSREYMALKLAYFIFSERLFVEIRTKRNLSYAPSASLTSVANPVGFVYVSTTNPNEAATVIIDEILKIKKEGFTEKELKNQKESFLTSYFLGQETNSGQATTLGVAELRFGFNYALDYMTQIQSINLDELNKVFKKYGTYIQWYYLGDKSKVDESIFNSLK